MQGIEQKLMRHRKALRIATIVVALGWSAYWYAEYRVASWESAQASLRSLDHVKRALKEPKDTNGNSPSDRLAAREDSRYFTYMMKANRTAKQGINGLLIICAASGVVWWFTRKRSA